MGYFTSLLLLEKLEQGINLLWRRSIIYQDGLLPIVGLFIGGLGEVEQNTVREINPIDYSRLNVVASEAPARTDVGICPLTGACISAGARIARTRASLCGKKLCLSVDRSVVLVSS